MIALQLIFVMSIIFVKVDLSFMVPCSAKRLHRPVLSII